jgi:CHASE2 domain-containing sensor protein/tRNA A-37 threonylcarbamoyl transferase component Bud32
LLVVTVTSILMSYHVNSLKMVGRLAEARGRSLPKKVLPQRRSLLLPLRETSTRVRGRDPLRSSEIGTRQGENAHMNHLMKKLDLLIVTLVVAGIISLSYNRFPPFEALEKVFYSIEMRLDLQGSTGENKIAIVNIDEKSINQLGPWPWPRYLIADMINILKGNGAKMIGLDLMFSQREQNQGLEEVRKLYQTVEQRQKSAGSQPNYAWILEKLKEIEKGLDNDRKLTESVKKSGNIIAPVVGKFGDYDTELVIPYNSVIERNALKTVRVSKALEKFLSVNQLLTPYPELSESSKGLGHINSDPDKAREGSVHIPFINYRGHIIPSLPLRLALDYLNIYPAQVINLDDGIRLGDRTVPTANGEIFVKFKGARRSFPYYSFVDILKVRKVPAVFEDKIVLIGFTAQEGASSINTPVDPEMPRVELTANVIEDFLNGRYLKRPKSMIHVEALLVLLVGFGSAFFLPRLNYFPRTVLTGAFLFLLFITSTLFFTTLGIWFKITYVSLSLVSLYVVFSVKELIVREKSMELFSKESIETNKMLGLSLQSQGLLDLAFEKFKKCPPDEAMKDVLYNLGLDFERKRMLNKAVSVYDYVTKEGWFRDLAERIPKLRKLAGELSLGTSRGGKDVKILLSDDLETKPTVGRYEILGELGQGAMGMVYKARDPRINRELAIKTIRFSDEFEEDRAMEVKQRFFKEAELAGKLSHPSIISVYDVGEDYDLTYMAMELLDGKDLEDFCQKDTRLPLKKVLAIVADTAEALDYAHSQGVIHRDVKPANIMLLKNGRIKVTDFGIAKAVSSSQTKTGVILGTPNYMSPEQINGQEIDGRSDIFSLGVVFFQLLTGELPFRGKTLTELFYQITQSKHPSPRDINPKVLKPCEQLIDKALEKDPNRRFQRAMDFAKYLRILKEKMEQMKR